MQIWHTAGACVIWNSGLCMTFRTGQLFLSASCGVPQSAAHNHVLSQPARCMQVMYIVSQFVFGYGVGGEYPMAAGSAAERAEAGGKAMAKKRGREVVLTFSMQVRTLILCPCLCLSPACLSLLSLSSLLALPQLSLFASCLSVLCLRKTALSLSLPPLPLSPCPLIVSASDAALYAEVAQCEMRVISWTWPPHINEGLSRQQWFCHSLPPARRCKRGWSTGSLHLCSCVC